MDGCAEIVPHIIWTLEKCHGWLSWDSTNQHFNTGGTSWIAELSQYHTSSPRVHVHTYITEHQMHWAWSALHFFWDRSQIACNLRRLQIPARLDQICLSFVPHSQCLHLLLPPCQMLEPTEDITSPLFWFASLIFVHPISHHASNHQPQQERNTEWIWPARLFPCDSAFSMLDVALCTYFLYICSSGSRDAQRSMPQ